MADIIVFKAAKPDPRVWLLLIVVVSLLTFLCGSRIELFCLFVLLCRHHGLAKNDGGGCFVWRIVRGSAASQ